MYSFDNVNKDRWSELADGYQSMLDELANDEMPDVFIKVKDFDPYEVL
jgi:hypothetical protein